MSERGAGMWRNGVTNTIALVDRLRAKHGIGKIRNERVAAFEAELDAELGRWFDATRAAKPTTWDESEAVWKGFLAATPPERNPHGTDN